MRQTIKCTLFTLYWMLSEMNLEIQRLDKNIYIVILCEIFIYSNHLLDIRYLQRVLLVLTTQYEDNRDIDWSAGLSYAEGCVVARPWQCRALPSLHHPQCADPAQLSRTSPASNISPCHHCQQPPGLYTCDPCDELVTENMNKNPIGQKL